MQKVALVLAALMALAGCSEDEPRREAAVAAAWEEVRDPPKVVEYAPLGGRFAVEIPRSTTPTSMVREGVRLWLFQAEGVAYTMASHPLDPSLRDIGIEARLESAHASSLPDSHLIKAERQDTAQGIPAVHLYERGQELGERVYSRTLHVLMEGRDVVLNATANDLLSVTDDRVDAFFASFKPVK